MPVIKADFSWLEKKDTLKVSVPLKGVSASKADILVSRSTLKVNFAPYLLDIVLNGEIDPVRHKASVKDGMLSITLYKKDAAIWGHLESQSDDGTVLAAKKEQALKDQEELNTNMQTQRHDRKVADERLALRKQMKLEEMERSRLENLKQEEKEAAEQEVYETFAKMQMEHHEKLPARTMAPSNGDSEKNKIKKNGHVHFGNPTFSEVSSADGKSEPSPAAAGTMRSMEELLFEDDIDDDDTTSSRNGTEDKASVVNNIEKEIFSSGIDGDIPVVRDPCPEDGEGEGEGDYVLIDGKDVAETATASTPRTNDDDNEEEMRYVPPPRSAGVLLNAESKIDIIFTPRVFPTPMRESKAAEEEDWVAKNRRHLKKHGVLGKGAGGDVSEEDPLWLKAKGDDFLRAGDVRSALNAYSAALDADHTMTASLANRAVCYIKLGMFLECKADCSEAIKQISQEIVTTDNIAKSISQLDSGTPEAAVGGNSDGAAPNPSSAASSSFLNVSSSAISGSGKLGAMFVKLLMRRGAACCKLGAFAEALSDYQQASVRFQQLSAMQLGGLSAVEVTLESLQGDIARLKLLCSADSLKKEGDSLIAEQQPAAAKAKYDAALALVPVHVACLSNRAACCMAQGDLAGCVADCSKALGLLRDTARNSSLSAGSASSVALAVAEQQQRQHSSMLQTILPAPGSEKRKAWTIKTLLRRGVAYSQLGKLDQAVADYAAACALDPGNASLVSDLNKMRTLQQAAAAPPPPPLTGSDSVGSGDSGLGYVDKGVDSIGSAAAMTEELPQQQ